MSMGSSPEDSEPSGSEAVKTEVWRTITDPSKVIEMFYSEGNFYHDIYLEELSNLAGTSHKNVRDTLSRLRKKDERAGKYVPAPPRQLYEFTDEQRQVLEDAFNESPQMDGDGSREISIITGLTVKQINNWFCNQRRKADGRSAEKDKKRRERIRETMRRDGKTRVGTFSPDTVELFEKEYDTMMQLAAIGGGKVKIPYSDLVEKTGMDRKKIRDWFSKRKGKDRKTSEGVENTSIPTDNELRTTKKPAEREEIRKKKVEVTTKPSRNQPEVQRDLSIQTVNDVLMDLFAQQMQGTSNA